MMRAIIQLFVHLLMVKLINGFPIKLISSNINILKKKSYSFQCNMKNGDNKDIDYKDIDFDSEVSSASSVPFNTELIDKQDALSRDATHLIAIPLEDNKEFMLELESVQRAVLYNCPLLVRSVITPSSTKLPLLLVNTSPGSDLTFDGSVSSKSGLPGFDVTKSLAQRMKDEEVTQEINRIVQEVVNDVIRSKGGRHSFVVEDINQDENDEEEYNPEPVMLSFEGLEIEGSAHDIEIEHEILYVSGKEGKGDLNLMRFVVDEIRSRIESRGWTAGFIPYRPQGAERPDLDGLDMSDIGEDKWRARVPFMRLPPDFLNSLPPVKEGLFGSNMRSPDEGGDGISPLFWFEWRKDEFTPKKYGTRLREIAVYSRTLVWHAHNASAPSSSYNEYSFYIPRASTLLPTTKSAAVAKVEIDSKSYDDKRQQQNRIADQEAWDSSGEEYSKTRNSLFTGDDDTSSNANIKKKPSPKFKPPSPTERTGGARTEKKPIVRSYTGQSDDDKDNIESAKIRIKEKIESMKSKVPKESISRSIPLSQSPTLPKFPSDQHFIGFWRMVTSPLPQSPIDPEINIYDCDNLILRVDGTIAGGPIFDSILQLRAAGGSWRMFQAKYVGKIGEKQGDVQTRLRIEMIVPPKKDKILVMEGKVNKVAMGPDADSSGIASIGATGNSEHILTCSGDSYVQDIEGVRRKSGLFSIRKISTPEKVDFVFPVAPPSGIQ